ncbi:MAG TPA: hypothetical protein VMW34_09280 [Anaerolineales bacterium]|jgi:hypothetical protein|nr:hypothetical protein [Anaerolineales bacterium]HUV27546.1 hypothetical protein [Anaerolineales bacterium]
MRYSTVLPNLRILPAAALVPHEDCDPRRVDRLSQRLRAEGILKNPPVVAPIPDSEKYVVLDGANRALSFINLGIPHIIAQLVSYQDSGVELDTWYHVVAGMDITDFENALTVVTGLHLQGCSLDEARLALATHQAAAYIISANGVRMVSNTSTTLKHDTTLLNGLVRAYKGKANIYRASNDIWEIQKPYYPDITALVIFPRLTPDDIIHAAQSGEKIPTGITRHIIPHRALNINIPMDVLETDWPLERKEKWLQDWWMERMAANAIRFYSESTFSFNE